MSHQQFDELAINTIRFLAAEGVQKANSGHPGMPMGCAPIGYTLYAKLMNYNPADTKWVNRDRFVLSAGHGSMLLYSLLHLSGYGVSMDDLKNFRQYGGITPGHPEFGLTPGVETTTGPLGQGFANAVGMAIAQEHLAARFNKDGFPLINHYIYGICSDGDLMEGISHEAASLAGHLQLGKIIFYYDDNGISIDGHTSLSFSENIAMRFEAYGWHIQHIADVNDTALLEAAAAEAHKDPRPSLIITKTHIGYGSPNKQDTESAHGSPLGYDEIALTKKNLGWENEEQFYVPAEVSEFFANRRKELAAGYEQWQKMFEEYKKEYPELAAQLTKAFSGVPGEEFLAALPQFPADEKGMATRAASGKVLNAIAPVLPELIGGSADLAPSNNTYLAKYEAFSATTRGGRNFHFGIREHGMGSALNGMAMYGGVIPYGGTFLVFSDYCRPVIRLAALSHIRPIFVFTHDSIGLGEDGPTHQPVEHLAALRSIPNHLVLRPADANETAEAWKVAVQHTTGPVSLILTRQNVPTLDRTQYAPAQGLAQGAYVLGGANAPDVVLMASGSEVGLIIKAAALLEAEGVKVSLVSFPSWELFEKQSDEYKASVLPASAKVRFSVEAGVSLGWSKYATHCISIDKFGASAPEKVLWKEYGFTPEAVAARVKAAL